jgi:hypothetical protein
MDQLVPFGNLITRFMSEDNAVRKLAEEEYEKFGVNERAMLLLQVACVPEIQTETRSMALVLLRRLVLNSWNELTEAWAAMSSAQNTNALASFRATVLVGVQNETVDVCRRRYCDLIAEIARQSLDTENGDRQDWQECLQFLFESASSPNEKMKDVALQIVEAVPHIFGGQLAHYLPVVQDMLSQCLSYEGSLVVQGAACKASTAFIVANEDDNVILKSLSSLLPLMLLVIAKHIDGDDDESVWSCLEELAANVPKFLRPRLTDIFTMCTKVVGDTEMPNDLRHTALEVLITWAENAAAAVRKDGAKFVPLLVEQCLALMVDVEDDDEWETSWDDEDDDDADSNWVVGETSLDRLACALGGKTVLPHCRELVPKMLNQPGNWKYRHAGLNVLSAIGEGCHKQMESTLQSVVETIIPFFGDKHPRVRYAACNALGQMSCDFAPTMQKRLHDKVIPVFLNALGDVSSPRIQAHVGAALVNFSEDCPKSILVPYLDQIMLKLCWVLENAFQAANEKPKRLVLEQIITTIASVADVTEEQFTAYYDRVMPCLKYILENAITKEVLVLRGKTIECVSLIGLAVGKERFLPDATQVMEVLLKAQSIPIGAVNGTENEDKTDDVDPQQSYMISAWARMCRLLGKDFQPFLPQVMPAVIAAASMRPEVMVMDSEEAAQLSEEDDWSVVKLGDKQCLGLRTCGMEDKATACQMLVCYARELKDVFADYVKPVAELMVPMLKFYFHDDVRIAAAECIPHLLESARDGRGPEFVAEIWASVAPELINAIDVDPDAEVVAEHMHSLAQSVEILGVGCLTDDHMNKLLEIIDKRFKQHFLNQAERAEKAKDPDFDTEVEEELIEEVDVDIMILSKMADITHAFFSTHKEVMFPVFDKLLPYVAKLMEANQPAKNRQWGMCIFDDLIEFTGPHSVKYQQFFLPTMIAALEDEESSNRQAAAYGFGVMALNGGNAYAQVCAEALPLLGKMIERPDARTTELASLATDNAISAVAKILSNHGALLDTAQMIPHWLNWLPTWEDKEESPFIYGYLCDLIEGQHPAVIGDNLKGVVRVIAEAFHRHALGEAPGSNEVNGRLVNLLKQLQPNMNLAEACTSADQVAALEKVLA